MFYVLEALSSLGDYRRQMEYLNLWKSKGDNPDAFLSMEPYLYQAVCNSHALRRALKRNSNKLTTADIISTYYGKPSVSLIILRGIKESDYLVRDYGSREFRDFLVDNVRVRAHLYMGNRVDLSVLERDYEIAGELINVYTFLLKISSGEFDSYDEAVDKVLKKAFAKGSKASVMALMRYKAFVEIDIFNLELLKHTFTVLGDRYSAILTEIFLDFLTEKKPIDLEDIPPDSGFLRVHYNLMRKYRFGEDYEPPEDMKGIADLWWYVNRRKKGKPYLSFAGKLKLYDGVKEIKFRTRRTLIALAYLLLLGRNGLERNLNVVFPNVRRPKRRLYQSLAELGRYRYIPSDYEITLRRGNFLRDEHEPWAELLKRRVGVLPS